MSQRFDSAILHYKFINVLKIMEWNLILLLVGFCVGAYVSYRVVTNSKKQELEDLRKQMDRDNHLYLFAVEEYEEKISKLSQELTVQRNVAKTLGENNQRLLKSNKDLKNCQHPNDETIAYMVSLYGNWVDRSAEDYHLSPSEFIKKYWK